MASAWYNRHFGDAESSDEDAKSHHDEAYNAAGPFEVINVAGFGGSNATTDASKIRRLNEAHRLRRANEINEINEINGGSRNIMEIGNSSDDDADAEYCDNARGNNINVDTGNSNTGMVIGASTTHNNNSNNNNNRPSNSKSNKSASNGKANGNLLSHGFTRASQSDKLRMQYLEEQVKTAVALRVKAETEAQMAEEMRAHQERMQDIELRAKQNETGMY
ncbi:hypothetical protein GGR50DRAFT_534202 [Xylaria sp. CBS 124048]|nr:hypothetical protein GGR50DRAFT_534202 [Xylaria sp. CBS 124048]